MDLSGVIDVPRLAGLRERHTHQLALIGYTLLVGFGLHLEEASGRTICLSLIAAIGLLASAASYRRARAIADIATSRIGSAAQGYVEVMGKAKADPSIQIAPRVLGARPASHNRPRPIWRAVSDWDLGASFVTFY